MKSTFRLALTSPHRTQTPIGPSKAQSSTVETPSHSLPQILVTTSQALIPPLESYDPATSFVAWCVLADEAPLKRTCQPLWSDVVTVPIEETSGGILMPSSRRREALWCASPPVARQRAALVRGVGVCRCGAACVGAFLLSGVCARFYLTSRC